MTDDELEGQLRAHYGTIDPVRAPGDLGRRIEDAMDRRASRPVFVVRARPAFAVAVAAALIVAVGLGFRPGGFFSTVGASPSPSASPAPTRSAICAPDTVALSVTGWGGAAGTTYAVLHATLIGPDPCRLPTGPAVQIVDANGANVVSAPRSDDQTAPLVSTLDLRIGWSSWCAPLPPAPLTVKLTLASGVLSAALPDGFSASCQDVPTVLFIEFIEPVIPQGTPAPTGSPPVSGAAWTGIQLQAVDGGPVAVSSVVTWAGGYIALGQPNDRAPLPAWTSRDGRTWTALPSGTFGVASSALGARFPGGVIVAVEDATGQGTVHRSTDGLTWTSDPGPRLCDVNSCPSVRTLRLSLPDTLAGNEAGVVAITSPDGVAFSADGITWQLLPWPGPAAAQVQGVATFGSGFVAVGTSGTTSRSPVAWWSKDGLDWTRAMVDPHTGDGFTAVYAANGGLIALSSTVETPGRTSFWTSSDGRTWKLGTDPLGLVQSGEGQGSANGVFSGDGTRLLGFDPGATSQSAEYWTSLDGSAWTKLTVTGDGTVASTIDLSPFLLRDGILFSGDTRTWFGEALP